MNGMDSGTLTGNEPGTGILTVEAHALNLAMTLIAAHANLVDFPAIYDTFDEISWGVAKTAFEMHSFFLR